MNDKYGMQVRCKDRMGVVEWGNVCGDSGGRSGVRVRALCMCESGKGNDKWDMMYAWSVWVGKSF